MSAAAYAGGLVLLALEVVAVTGAAVAVRRAMFDEWTGPQAWLATAALGLLVVFGVALPLGALGWFRPLPVALGLVGVSALAVVAARSLRRGLPEPSEPAGAATESTGPDETMGPAGRRLSKPSTVDLVAAAGSTLVLATVWVAHTVRSYRVGILDGDSLWYHLPFAARFLQDGLITRPHPVNGDPLVAYFPAHNEVLHGLLSLPMHRDLLSPLLNLGWLALALLSGWCLGARHGRGPVGLAGVGLVLSVPLMTYSQAGTARNDLAGMTLLLVAVALVSEALAGTGPHRLAATALASAMLGLAVGVKVSMLVPVGLVFMGAAVLWWLDGRRTSPAPSTAAPIRSASAKVAAAWLGPLVVVGSYWYVRNWRAVGNPLPWLSANLGPVHLHAARLPKGAIQDSAVVDRAREHGFWSKLVEPGLRYGVGRLWPVLALVVVAAVGVGLARGRSPMARPWSLLGAVGLVAYLFTPNTAPNATGPPLAADLFILNARYALPALALVMAGLATRPASASGWLRWAGMALVPVLALTTVVELAQTRLNQGVEWRIGGLDLAVSVAVVLGSGAAVAGCRHRSRRPSAAADPAGALSRLPTSVKAAVGILAGGLLLWPLANASLDNRYRSRPFAASATWGVGRQLHNQRVGLFGDFFQYPFVGPDLSNHVQYLGNPGPHGAFDPARTCRQWRQALIRERVRYVVITPQVFTGNLLNAGPIAWTRAIPDAADVTPAGDRNGARVFRLDRAVNPNGNGCR